MVEHDLSLEADGFKAKGDTVNPVVEDANNLGAIFGTVGNETKEESKVEESASTTEGENEVKEESPVASGPAVFDDLNALLNSEDTSAKVEEPVVAVAENHVEEPKVVDNSDPFTMVDDLYSPSSTLFDGYNDLVSVIPKQSDNTKSVKDKFLEKNPGRVCFEVVGAKKCILNKSTLSNDDEIDYSRKLVA